VGAANQSTTASKALCLKKFARPWITRTGLEIFREQKYFSFARNWLTSPRSSRVPAGHDITTLHRLLLRIETFNNLFVLFGPWITYIIFTYGRPSVAKKYAVTLKRGNVYCLSVCVSDITFFLCKQNANKKIQMKSSNILDSQTVLTFQNECCTFLSKCHQLITFNSTLEPKTTKVNNFRALRVEGKYIQQTKANESNPERAIGHTNIRLSWSFPFRI
jgi:hypothetical protein